jgi:hypothetical protein
VAKKTKAKRSNRSRDRSRGKRGSETPNAGGEGATTAARDVTGRELRRMTASTREAVQVDVARMYFHRGDDGKLIYGTARIKEKLDLESDRRIVTIAEGTVSTRDGGPLLALSLRDTRPTTEELRKSHKDLKKDFPLVFDRLAGVVVDELLSERLGSHFAPVWSATAVRMPPHVASEEMPIRKSNRVHSILANAMAAYVLGFARDGDHAGFGGGRGPLDTCEVVQRSMDIHARHPERIPQWTEMRLTSLTGRLGATRWPEEGEAEGDGPDSQGRADADDSVLAFAGACASPTIEQVNSAIAMPEEEDRDTFINRRARHLDLSRWKDELVPDWCLIGVGAAAVGHRLMRDNDRLRPVQDEVQRIRNILKEYDETASPVGDVCNRLFVVERIVEEKHRDELSEAVRKVNERWVCVTEEHLRLVERVLIVAGGVEKAGALVHVLRESLAGKKVVLVTDTECAGKMLDMCH